MTPKQTKERRLGTRRLRRKRHCGASYYRLTKHLCGILQKPLWFRAGQYITATQEKQTDYFIAYYVK
jgi:hypothetical protein